MPFQCPDTQPQTTLKCYDRLLRFCIHRDEYVLLVLKASCELRTRNCTRYFTARQPSFVSIGFTTDSCSVAIFCQPYISTPPAGQYRQVTKHCISNLKNIQLAHVTLTQKWNFMFVSSTDNLCNHELWRRRKFQSSCELDTNKNSRKLGMW